MTSAPKTQHDYVRVVADFARFLGRSPDQAEPEGLRRYQLHLASDGASPAKMNAAVSALRFFFKATLTRAGFGERLATVRKEDRLPEVLSPEGVALMLHCAPSLKHKATLIRHYGLLAKGPSAQDLGRLRTLIAAQAEEAVAPAITETEPAAPDHLWPALAGAAQADERTAQAPTRDAILIAAPHITSALPADRGVLP